ncbi:hypothetical protein RNJ44_04857 [Nakaseomyces bracarensis]|uniref:Uncharacterized protein n=1 Tax=Nakaseomyces bracarensis TaxID=273131 RepID=A0ABR4NW92_9SACH
MTDNNIYDNEDWVICLALVKYKLRKRKRLNKRPLPKISDLDLYRDVELNLDILKQYIATKLDAEKAQNIKLIYNLIWLTGTKYERELRNGAFISDHSAILNDIHSDITQKKFHLHYIRSYHLLLVNLVHKLRTSKTNIEKEYSIVLYRCYQLMVVSYSVLRQNYRSSNIVPIKKYLIDHLLFSVITGQYAALYFKSAILLAPLMRKRVPISKDFDTGMFLRTHFETVQLILNNLIEDQLKPSLQTLNPSITIEDIGNLMRYLLLLLQNFIELVLPITIQADNRAFSKRCSRYQILPNACDDFVTDIKKKIQISDYEIKDFCNSIIQALLDLYTGLKLQKLIAHMPNSFKKNIFMKRRLLQAMLLMIGNTKMLAKFRSIKWINVCC